MTNCALLSADAPVDHHRDPLPGPEGRHALQLLVCNPYWNQELLGVAGAQSASNTNKMPCYLFDRERSCLVHSEVSTQLKVRKEKSPSR